MPALERPTHLIEPWQHHAAAIGVFLVWGELMLMVGRYESVNGRTKAPMDK